jgi:hypothetical protein
MPFVVVLFSNVNSTMIEHLYPYNVNHTTDTSFFIYSISILRNCDIVALLMEISYYLRLEKVQF